MVDQAIMLNGKDIEFSFPRNGLEGQDAKNSKPDIGPLDLQLFRGTKTALIGASGSGKSTTLKLMAGLLTPSRGSVNFRDVNVAKLSEAMRAKIRRTRFAFIFQDYMLMDNLSVAENIILPIILNSDHLIHQSIVDVMSQVNLDPALLNNPVYKLSGGQKQRVAISRALMMKADILFADEPTGNLDPHARDETLDAIDNAMKNGLKACLIVTHDPIVAARADCVLLMKNGKITQHYGKLSADCINNLLEKDFDVA